METETIILIITNIIVPILVAFITGFMKSKKYKKEIELLNAAHENRIKEINNEHAHEIEKLELQYKHQQELESQRVGNQIVDRLTDKLSDAIIKQPATQKMINQKTTQNFLSKKKH